MTDDAPQRILIGLDWRSTGKAVGIITAVIFAAWAAWAALSWLFGTTLGRAVLGLLVLAGALYVILTDDEVDLDDALTKANAAAEPPSESEPTESDEKEDDDGGE